MKPVNVSGRHFVLADQPRIFSGCMGCAFAHSTNNTLTRKEKDQGCGTSSLNEVGERCYDKVAQCFKEIGRDFKEVQRVAE